MDIRVLRYFLAVAREGNISNAAKNLHVTQPTLSRQLMDLETDLGVKLLLRSSGNRSISLTEDGMMLRKRAQEILALVDKTESELTAPRERISGQIHIGSGETPVISEISKVIKEIQQENPELCFHFFSGNADNVAERLDNGLTDFGIMADSLNISKYTSIALPSADRWGLLMRKDHALSEKKFIRSEDLRGLPLISSSQRLTSSLFSKWLKDDYDKLNHVATYTLLYNASLLVKDNIGCALCLDNIISTSESSGLCFRPLEPRLEIHWYVVWKKYQVFSKAAELFLQKLIEAFGDKQ